MSGFQEIAAVIGIAEVSFRSISRLYEFVSGLKNAPKELRRIQNETSTLAQSLLALDFLRSADSNTRAVIQRVGLRDAIANCDTACQSLQAQLSRWTDSDASRFKSKVHFRFHRKAIDATLEQISFAKQTTILCVVISQLSIQLQSSFSELEKASEIALAEQRLTQEAAEAAPAYRRHSKSGHLTMSRVCTLQDLRKQELDRLKSVSDHAKNGDIQGHMLSSARRPGMESHNSETANSHGNNGSDGTSSSQGASPFIDQTFRNTSVAPQAYNKQGANVNTTFAVQQRFEGTTVESGGHNNQGSDLDVSHSRQQFENTNVDKDAVNIQGSGNRTRHEVASKSH